MLNDISVLGYGIITFGVLIGVGTVVLFNFGGSMAKCSGVLGGTSVWNATLGSCSNGTDTGTPTGDGYTNTAYLQTQLGSSGLAGWTPAIIAISVGLLFLGAFVIGKSGRKAKGRY